MSELGGGSKLLLTIIKETLEFGAALVCKYTIIIKRMLMLVSLLRDMVSGFLVYRLVVSSGSWTFC